MKEAYRNGFSRPKTNARQLRRILLVEDDYNIKLAYQFFLRKIGFDVHCVETAREALLLTQKESYDAMVLDLGLPDASGETVISTIRARENITLNRLPIIVITAHGDDISKQSCQKKGADDFFIKPVSLDKFRHVLGAL